MPEGAALEKEISAYGRGTAMDALRIERTEALAELEELGELWLERHVCGLENVQVSTAIGQATQEVRRVERKLRRCAVKG